MRIFIISFFIFAQVHAEGLSPVDLQKIRNGVSKKIDQWYMDFAPKLASSPKKAKVCTFSEDEKAKNNYWPIMAEGSICFPGMSCDFYQCMDKKVGCGKDGYFMAHARPICQAFEKAGPQKFSLAGFDWISNVTFCLQKSLIQSCDVKAPCSDYNQKNMCEKIKTVALAAHPDCFTEHGFCDLKISDLTEIAKIIPLETDTRFIKIGAKVSLACARQWTR